MEERHHDRVTTQQRAATRSRIHPAWVVAAVTLLALVAAATFRSSTGVLMEPIEREFGWDRATTSGAVSLNLVLYGLAAPFAAAVMERFGIRRTVTTALVVVGYDGSGAAAEAVRWADSLARRTGSALRVVWAWKIRDVWDTAVAEDDQAASPPMREL